MELCSLDKLVAMPLNPAILTSGVVPRSCHIFKSAKYPAVFTFNVHPSSRIDWTQPPRSTAGLAISEAALRAAGNAVHHYRSAGTSVRIAQSLEPELSSVNLGLSSPGGHSTHSLADADLEHIIHEAITSNVPEATPAATYRLMAKNGDDLRQDQLIIQMISLMDSLLKAQGLDLRLTPYRVLATSTSSGLMEFVLDSQPVSSVLKRGANAVLSLFRERHPDLNGPLGVQAEVMDTYLRSTAGYCVVTYLLAIGDRHLDNIMLTSDGHFFHLDFGYIFGKDPKPRPAQIRVTGEMIDGMGGPTSEYYRQFALFCGQAYTILRRSAGLILSLLNLMREAGISALTDQPDIVIAKVCFCGSKYYHGLN
jgi:phosphatidylinositol 3-kinase